ncbi:MAG: hypothetical protein K2X82_19945 [Gemmataceae bacterium]|nr:hypothetical protein [Gemmataceae bacterium]
MKSVITAAVAALALFATAGSASAQHGGGHAAPAAHHPVAPVHHGVRPPLGHAGYPAAGFGVGVSAVPVYGGPVYGGGVVGYPAPVYSPAHSYRPVPHHRSRH